MSFKKSGLKCKKQNHLASHTQKQATVVIGAWIYRKCKVEKQFQTNMFFNFMKGV